MSSAGARPPLPGTEEETGDGLLIRRIPAGTMLWRCHRAAHGALFFGDAGVDFRFNDPGPGASHHDAPAAYAGSRPNAGAYGVCYFGFSPEAAFVETFLRRPTRRDVSMKEIAERLMTRVRTARELRLVQLDGPGLNRARVEASVVSGRDYVLSRAVSRLLWLRDDEPDGIVYAARHDNHLFATAVYHRASPALIPERAGSIGDDFLRQLLGTYRFRLI